MDLQNYHEWIAERQRLLERIKELEAENAELRKRLGEDVVPSPASESLPPVPQG
jgi:regulator of replication initiation timing